MYKLIDSALAYKRTVIMILVLLVVNGIIATLLIPKEEMPDVSFPSLYITVTLDGISAQDADQLLVLPLTRELKDLDGLKEASTTAAEGYAGVLLEFESDIDIDEVLPDVREKVDRAKSEFPDDTKEPKIIEFNAALFPVMTITLSGEIDQRQLFTIADALKDRIEALEDVLSVDVSGKRDDLAEIIIDPGKIESYGLTIDEIIDLTNQNNALVAAGELDTGEGLFNIKVPGLLRDELDLLNLPIKRDGDTVVTFKDLAHAQFTFTDARSYSRFNGVSAVSMEISKRIGANLLRMTDQIKAIITEAGPRLPQDLVITYAQDGSIEVRDSLNNLFNNVIAATLLVVIVAIFALGLRTALLIGITIPSAFLIALLILQWLDFTLNIVVLFALILSVGMLVDGAIVVSEFADMRMLQGVPRQVAYREAAKRMTWPIIASTATTLAAFFPLVFWPDTIGEFMKLIPITVLITLSAALVLALIGLPVFGAIFGKPNAHAVNTRNLLEAASRCEYATIRGFTGWYLRGVQRWIRYPWLIMLLAIASFIGSIMLFNAKGNGVEFFPFIEPENALIDIRARGDLSLDERNALVHRVENIALAEPAFRFVTTNVFLSPPENAAKDLIGRINIKFADWQLRRPAKAIMEDFRRYADFPGIIVETRLEEGGPPSEADIVFELRADDKAELDRGIGDIAQRLETIKGLRDIRDSRPLPGIDWEVEVDREAAARFGASVTSVGNMIKMITTGLNISDYVPEGSDEKVDIRLRYPLAERNLDRLLDLRVPVGGASVPLRSFITFTPRPKESEIARRDGDYYYIVQANIESGERIDRMTAAVTAVLEEPGLLPETIRWQFRGDQEKQAKSQRFLMQAFGVALFIMLLILVTQFNSFRQALLILSAILFSTAGVFLGLLARGEAFGIVMSGIGIIALAGIVVNNNIILIDTFNILRRQGLSAEDAVLQTCAQRFRPVLLTTITTITGLMPMVLQLSFDFVQRTITIGAPSTQWWVQLATAIAGGLTFATVITLVLTPTLLAMGARRQDQKRALG